MTKPGDFILSTDYATVKNDGKGTVNIVVPGSSSVTGIEREFTSDITLGEANASLRVQVAGSRDGRYYATQLYSVERTGTVGGSSAVYSVYGFVSRTSPTTLRCHIKILNPYGSTLTTQSGNETFTFDIRTFKSAFTD